MSAVNKRVINDAIAAIDALLEPLRCTDPGRPAPGIEHCAACCYGTGWELTCDEDEGYLRGLLDARAALVELRDGSRAEPREPLVSGDVLTANPCHARITQVGDRETWAWCEACRAPHIIDRALFESGRGPWRRKEIGEATS